MIATAITDDVQSPYRRPVDTVRLPLRTDSQRGLSESEVQARLQKYGRNELAAEKPVTAWKKFLAQFGDVLVIQLLVATVIDARNSCDTCSRRTWAKC
jgi:Ca2+-transporting ATPase